jgi:hypothetical protein
MMIDKGKLKKLREKMCSSTTSFTMNLTRSHLELNLRLCEKKPPSNRLRYGMAPKKAYIC